MWTAAIQDQASKRHLQDAVAVEGFGQERRDLPLMLVGAACVPAQVRARDGLREPLDGDVAHTDGRCRGDGADLAYGASVA